MVVITLMVVKFTTSSSSVAALIVSAAVTTIYTGTESNLAGVMTSVVVGFMTVAVLTMGDVTTAVGTNIYVNFSRGIASSFE